MPRKAKNPSSIYAVHPSIHMVVDWIANLKPKTGRSLEEWIEWIQTKGPKTEVDRRGWLKSEYQLGTNTAWWLAERAEGKGEEDTPEGYLAQAPLYVENMFQGKDALRPIYDKLLELGRSLGKEVKFCPCKTIVPFYRNHVFAQVKPSTRTRIDFGFALGDTPTSGKLIDTGGFQKKDRITHRIPLTKVSDIDAEVKKWLQVAYERDA
jgi:hypothetical protein